MSINYNQSCLVGVKLYYKDLTVIDSPAEYQLQDRYDTRTGKITWQESILVKSEEWHIEFNGKAYDDYNEIANDYGLDYIEDYQDGCVYIGAEINVSQPNFGRADLLKGQLCLDAIQKLFKRVEKVLNMPAKMYFIPRVG